MTTRKIKRRSTTNTTSPPAPDRHEAFTKWSRERDVEICSVAPTRLPGRGLGLVTTAAIAKDDRILFVPERAMFKPNLALLKKHGLTNASPQAQLAYSAMVSCKDQGESMRIWQSTWPTDKDFKHSLPMRWPKRLRDLLPPSVDQPLCRMEDDYERDWKAVQASKNGGNIDAHDFRYSWSIVNSRSFHWKPPRGRAGSMVMCPFIDYMNHGPSNISCNVVQRPHGYEVLAERDYESGEEVLATYGAHPNDKLLVHYGFVLPTITGITNIDDDVRLDHLLLPKLTGAVTAQLQDVGFLGGYALLPATNELCFKTQVAVRAMLLTCNEWEHFVSCGEDLADDHSMDVDRFMKPLLAEYRDQAKARLKILATEDFDGMLNEVDIMQTRWQQIIDAIDNFIE